MVDWDGRRGGRRGRGLIELECGRGWRRSLR